MSNKDNIQAAAERYAADHCEHCECKSSNYRELLPAFIAGAEWKEQRANIHYQRIVGEFTGTLQGLLYYAIPEDVKANVRSKIAELELIPTNQ